MKLNLPMISTMPSDDEDVFMLYWWLRNKKRKRRYWIHPLLKDREHSSYVDSKELTANEDKFQSFLGIRFL
jgi:hypothetical protein